MAIACPHCKHSFSPKTVKPGKYAAKCPKCARGFQLVVPDPGATTAALDGESGAASSLPAPKPTKEAGPKEVLTTLGGYQVLKLLGRGGMGAVYLARQISLDRLVAVKVMLPKAAANPGFVARFTREAYAAAQMVHHNVVQIYDIGSANNTHYFSMEYVKGESLMDLARREGKLDPEQAVGYILQAARGLKYGHDLGMIHRDVKPDNLMINDQGIVKVADLGLVKLADDASESAARDGAASLTKQRASPSLTRTGFAMGTPSFMAPEQAANSSAVGPAADVYSLGILLYQMLSGRNPWSGNNPLASMSQQLHTVASPVRRFAPAVPLPLNAITSKMIRWRRQERYQTVADLRRDLEHWEDLDLARFTLPDERPPTAEPRNARPSWLAIAAGAALFLAGSGLGALVASLMQR